MSFLTEKKEKLREILTDICFLRHDNSSMAFFVSDYVRREKDEAKISKTLENLAQEGFVCTVKEGLLYIDLNEDMYLILCKKQEVYFVPQTQNQALLYALVDRILENAHTDCSLPFALIQKTYCMYKSNQHLALYKILALYFSKMQKQKQPLPLPFAYFLLSLLKEENA